MTDFHTIGDYGHAVETLAADYADLIDDADDYLEKIREADEALDTVITLAEGQRSLSTSESRSGQMSCSPSA